jgi:hypothetical protein
MFVVVFNNNVNNDNNENNDNTDNNDATQMIITIKIYNNNKN